MSASILKRLFQQPGLNELLLYPQSTLDLIHFSLLHHIEPVCSSLPPHRKWPKGTHYTQLVSLQGHCQDKFVAQRIGNEVKLAGWLAHGRN